MENLDYEIQEIKSFISQQKAKDEAYFRALSKIVTKLQRQSIAQLLGNAAVKTFFELQAESAKAQLVLNKNAKGEFARYALGSVYQPAIGAHLSGNLQLAKDLASTASTDFNEDYEYEEDFTYGQFFYQLINQGFKLDKSFEPFLKQLKDLDEAGTGQYAMIDAAINQDADAYKEGFTQFLEEHEAYYAELDGTLSVDKEKFTTEGAVNVEGLAWLRIGEALGFSLKSSGPYLFLPEILVNKLWVTIPP